MVSFMLQPLSPHISLDMNLGRLQNQFGYDNVEDACCTRKFLK
jgi:hypothetical protein